MIDPAHGSCRDDAPPRVSVVVVHWNTPELLERCLASIAAAMSGEPHEVIVVDNGSRGAGRPKLTRRSGLRAIRNPCNRGFAAAANQGARAARGGHLLFLNSDVELFPGSLSRLLGALGDDARLGAIAPATVDADGGSGFPGMRLLGPLNHALALAGLAAARRVTAGARDADHAEPLLVPWARASTLLVSRTAFEALAGFDEGFFFYEEDEDFCWRLARRGYRVAVDPRIVVRDLGGASTRLAGDWPARSLYAGQLRFVGRRAGALGALIYRLAVGSVLLAKLGLCRSLPQFAERSRHVDHRCVPELLRLLSGRRSVVTTAALDEAGS